VIRMKIPNTLVSKLMKLGFKEYEAKVFLALSILGPSTASQIHEFSGVPRPRVYDVLKELKKKGFLEIQQSSPLIFRVPSIEFVMSQIEKEVIKTIKEVKSEIQKLKLETQVKREVYTLTLYGQKSILIKIKELISNAREVIYVGALDLEFFKPLLNDLRETHRRGVKIRLITLRKNYKSINKLKDFAEVYFVPVSPKNPLGVISLKILKNSKKARSPIGVVNIDGKEVIFIIREATNIGFEIVGIWVGLESVALLQRYLLEGSIGEL